MSFTHKYTFCSVCNVHEDVKPLLNDVEQKKLLHNIYIGKVNKRILPIPLYLQISKELSTKLNNGYDDKENEAVLNPFYENIHHFSAAKTYHLISECESQRANGSKLVSEKTFIDKVGATVTDFLDDYLFSEGEHSKQVGVMTKKWHNVVKRKTVPFLEYVTMKDGRVRPAHVLLDGIIRSANDAFWNTFYPPNGWMCRCKTSATKEGSETDLTDFDTEDAKYNTPKEFRYNFSKEEIVFPKDHPYFTVPNADKAFARKNFRLPIPDFK